MQKETEFHDDILESMVRSKARARWLESLIRYFKKNGVLFLLAAPGLIHLFMIQYLPMFGVVIAFKNYRNADGILGSKWVGLENFKFIFGSGTAWRITFNTVFMNVIFILTTTIVALFLAILLNEIYHSRLKQIYQLTLFLPFFVGFIIIGYVAYAFLGENGFINTTLKQWGLSTIQFFMEPKYWRSILTIANLWAGVGFSTVIYLSGIIAIHPDFYEAAQIDGANKWQLISKITLPLVSYLIVIQVLLAEGRIFFANFGLFYFVPQSYKNGQLLPVTDVIDTFVFRAILGGGGGFGASSGIVNLGMAAAAGLYQSIVGLVLVVLANTIVKKVSPDQALF